MCGIFGTYGYVNKQLLGQMARALRHRGRDDVGYFFDRDVALGNTRLSIIDIKGGHQPIHNEDSTIWITYNGEIYNFQDLRQQLAKLSHSFYTESDTEVVVHAYEEWEEKCTSHFNGMWAFAIWDSRRQELFLSRDRFGIKPLYYFHNGNKFVFASEIKAILLEKSVPKIPNDRIIYDYLLYGLHDHTEQTFFVGIKPLLPAHNLLISNGRLQKIKYWKIEQKNDAIEDSDDRDREYAEKFLEIFQDSVKRELVGEVPIGTCLSGGLDSSSISYTINAFLSTGSDTIEAVGKKQKTFSAAFEDKRIDERIYIENVVKDTRCEANVVFPSSKQLWIDLKKVVYYQDEPFISSSVFAQWFIMKHASQKVKVVLDGQGADELLGGYTRHYLVFLQTLWKKRKLFRFLKELLFSIDLLWPYFKRYLSLAFSKRIEERIKLLNREFAVQFADSGRDIQLKREVQLSDCLCSDLTEVSLPRLLRYEDRNSMAWSMEARVPFLDHRLVEYVFSIPATQKLKNGWTKYILRNSMKGVLPNKIRKRRDKIALQTPEETWLKELQKEIREVFASKEFGERKYFNQEEVLKRFDRFRQGKIDNDCVEMFWRILNLELWFRTFFDRKNL